MASSNGSAIGNRLSGFLFGFGVTGFLSRWLTEFTLWFGTARTIPRPQLGFVYPVSEHGTRYYVSAAEILLHSGILVFWLLFIAGLIIRPKRSDPERNFKIAPFDPYRLHTKWAWIGSGVMLALVAARYPLAEALMMAGVRPDLLAG